MVNVWLENEGRDILKVQKIIVNIYFQGYHPFSTFIRKKQERRRLMQKKKWQDSLKEEKMKTESSILCIVDLYYFPNFYFLRDLTNVVIASYRIILK